MSGRNTRAVSKQFVFKTESGNMKLNSSQTSGLNSGSSLVVTIKKEPDLPSPPPIKKRATKAKKDKLDNSNTRETRIEDLRKKYAHGVAELGISLVPDDMKEVADAVPNERDALRGLINFTFKRIMVRMLWIEPDVRAVIVRILLPRQVPQSDYHTYEVYCSKTYSHQSMKWRKLADEMAGEILKQLKDNVGDDDKLEDILTSHENFTEKFHLQNEDVVAMWKFAVPIVAAGIITGSISGMSMRYGIGGYAIFLWCI